MNQTYTVKQVADILGYSTNSIYSFLKEGRIKGVRVGKGRFRIAQEEVDRLLLTRPGKPLSSDGTPIETIQTQEGPKPSLAGHAIRTVQTDLSVLEGSYVLPSFFEWFIASISIILGVSLMLFSRDFEYITLGQFLPWLLPIQVSFIAGGLGYLFTCITRKKNRLWKLVFELILLVAYLAYGLIVTLSHQWGLSYIIVSAVLLFSIVLSSRNLWMFVVLETLLFFAYTISFLFFSSWQPESLVRIGFTLPSLSISSLILVSTIVFVAIGLWSYKKWPAAFFFIMSVKASFYLAFALLFTYDGHSGQAIFLAVLGLFSVLVGRYGRIEPIGKSQRNRVYGAYACTIAIFLIGIGTNRLMQLNSYDYSKRELTNKVNYGKTLVEHTISSVQSALEGVAKNSSFIEAIEKNDTKYIISLSRTLFESSRYIQSVVIMGVEGEVANVYPLEANIQRNDIPAQFFTKAKQSGLPSVTNLISEEEDGSGNHVVYVYVPLFDSKNQFIGVLSGSIALENLNARLQALFPTEDDGSVLVVDNTYKRIIDPDWQQVGTVIEPNDPVRHGVLGKNGTDESYSQEGIRTLVAYDTFRPYGWAIGVKLPLNRVLQSTYVAVEILIVVVISSVVVFTLFYWNLPISTASQWHDTPGQVDSS